MTLGKRFLLWSALLIIGFAFGDGGAAPSDPVFYCLSATSRDALKCYNNSQRAHNCLTSLKNFVAPLKVLASQKQPDHVCTSSGNTLNKTLHGLLRVLETAIKDIYIYARRHNIPMKPFQLKRVDTTRMASLAYKHGFLDKLSTVTNRIYLTAGSCFNTKVQFTDVCPVS